MTHNDQLGALRAVERIMAEHLDLMAHDRPTDFRMGWDAATAAWLQLIRGELRSLERPVSLVEAAHWPQDPESEA